MVVIDVEGEPTDRDKTKGPQCKVILDKHKEKLDRHKVILDQFLEKLVQYLQRSVKTKLFLSNISGNLSNISRNLSNISRNASEQRYIRPVSRCICSTANHYRPLKAAKDPFLLDQVFIVQCWELSRIDSLTGDDGHYYVPRV